MTSVLAKPYLTFKRKQRTKYNFSLHILIYLNIQIIMNKKEETKRFLIFLKKHTILKPNPCFIISISFLETNESTEQKEYAKKNAKNIFIVLIIITVLGTTLASPTATLADTATLENLGMIF